MGNSVADMGPPILRWEERLARLRARAEALSAAGAQPALLPLDAALSGYARLKDTALPLLESASTALGSLCPVSYPRIEDNAILGPGGSIGIRFSARHAFHFAIENARRLKKAADKPKGLAGVLDVPVKRMPGDPLPPRDPSDRFELVVLALRWDADRGWVEVRRVLPAAWTNQMLEEHFDAYLSGFVYDAAAGLVAG